MSEENLINALRNEEPEFIGYASIETTGGMFSKHVSIVGITKLSEEKIREIINSEMTASDVQITVIEPQPISHQEEKQGDEVTTLFMGMFPADKIFDNEDYKIENTDQDINLKEWYREFRFLTPIILDKNLRIIDGHTRLKIALNSNTEYVSVVILDTDTEKSNALRLGLNRTAEFQRWNYNEVDKYVDREPVLQPILEPIGFFSNNVLPTSFFSSTIVQYKYDEYNDQMKKYMQDTSLLEWAEVMRKRNKSLDKDKLMKEKDYSRHSGLLNIEYKKDDLLPVHNTDDTMDEALEHVTKMADTITKNFDKERKAEMKEKGIAWQKTHMTSKQLAAKKRAEAESKNE